jgi:radical SAM family RiPP maturation amino acid epimerase
MVERLEIVAFRESIQARRSEEQLSRIARVKRFQELLIGDAQFRIALAGATSALGDSAALERYLPVVGLDLHTLRPLWDPQVAGATFDRNRWPVVSEWLDWQKDLAEYRHRLRDLGSAGTANPEFDEWRRRQIVRLSTELPPANAHVQIYPPIAFELSDGCSIGCAFCGVSAAKFKGWLPYGENRTLWREVVAATVNMFGRAAALCACYWATEPFDNPDFLRFIDDVYQATGFLPQTTTAAALRNIEQTRECLTLANRYGCGYPRFSVLTNRQLQTIHATFTPEELVNVDIVNHAKGALTKKAPAGRLFKPDAPLTEHATIACVIGFLVNMVTRTIRQIVPTLPSEQWPDGYRVLGEATFWDGAEFERALRALQSANCRRDRDPNRVLKFRSDLKYEQVQSGFKLAGAGGTVTIENHPFARQLGEILNRGDRCFEEIVKEVSPTDAGALSLSLMIKTFRQQELLEDFDHRA